MNQLHATKFRFRCSLAVVLLLGAGALGACGPATPAENESVGSGNEALVLSGITLQTVLVPRYVGAQNNGGGAVIATATVAQAWETFSVEDINGGSLVSGDSVFIRAGNGQYFQAVNGGGSTLNAASNNKLGWETFKVVRQNGAGTVNNGDIVGFQTSNGAWISAQNGGGGTVYAYGAAFGSWERFKIAGLGSSTPPPTASSTRVVGYLPNWYGTYASWVSKVDFSKVTQLNLAFALADGSGNLQLSSDADLKVLIDAAHARGVKVYPSLCGGGGDDRIVPFYQPSQVDAFVDKIMNFAMRNHFDGIDVDVEAPDRMGSTYDTFIAKLKARASAVGLPVTAAVAQWMQYGMSDTTLRSFDAVNVMSYDNTGTWTGAGEHSTYQQAVDALNYYAGRGVARSKIVLGVPFYGYCWGNCGGSSSTYVLYKDILAKFPNAASSDWIDQNGAKYSYNGVSTMTRKTDLAQQWGGIMIWELGGDVSSTSSNSLLLSIHKALQ